MHIDFVTPMTGIISLLLLASGVGYLLRRCIAPDGSNVTIQYYNACIVIWWGLTVFLGIALLAGRGGIILLFAFVSFAALREFVTLIDRRRTDHWAIAAAFFIILPVQFWLIYMDWYGMWSILIPVYAFLILPIIAALQNDTEDFLERVSQIQWALMICVFCASHVPAFLLLDIPGYEERTVLLIAFLIVVVQLSDVLQHAWGNVLGRRQVAPRLSASKTWEGLVLGVASATCIGAALWWITPFTPLQAALMSLLISLAGFFGGLVMSAIKRDRGVKDWGHLIAGHGGFIDRLDTVIFSAPFFFHITRYFWSAT